MRPMLGARVDDVNKLRFPLLVSRKLDGIRALWLGDALYSRTMKRIPNERLQVVAAENLPNFAIDGELICGTPSATDVFVRTSSAVRTRDSNAEIHFYVFDCPGEGAFEERFRRLETVDALVVVVQHQLVNSPEALLALEAQVLAEGYEGLILRDPQGSYKYGRSTLHEQGMLKLKRFIDDEGVVVGLEELQHNNNLAEKDERGYTKRSSHQENLVAGETLGALVISWRGKLLRIGTGFTAQQRQEIWSAPESYTGRLVKFKYLPVGVVELPRHPVFIDFPQED